MPRIARERDPGRTGQRHGGVEHAFLFHQRIKRRGVGARQPHAAVRNRDAEVAFGFGAMDRMPDLGEEDRMRHRRVVEFLGEVVGLHPEGAEGAVRSLVRRIAGRNRPFVSLDAVDRDGHHLIVLVDGDFDFGLGGAGREQHQTGNGNEEGTHFTFGLRALTAAPLTVPGTYMPEVRLWFQRPASGDR